MQPEEESEPLIKPLSGFDYYLVDKYTRKEKEYYASEYDKCFGTTPRSDKN